jgi:tetratricopeptide (TPR) repeat protein
MTPRPAVAFRVAVAVVLALVVASYANHWTNPFHFDDEHTIVQNPNLHTLANLPRFWSDATAASIYPTHAVYRPVTYTTLLVDYALAGGLDARVFHVSTFVAFLVLLWAIYALGRAALDAAAPGDLNQWFALVGAALFGVHPVSADTVNYIIQRAEVWATLGTVAAVAVFAARPGWRRYGVYLVPGVLGILAKTTASIFPFLILAYAAIVDRDTKRGRWVSFGASLGASAATTALCGAFTYSTGTFDPGAPPASQYRWTQPWIIGRYVRDFFLPIDLSIDPGWSPLASPYEARALVGYVVVAGLVALAVWAARRRATAPVSFGLAWFLVALVPVSVFPLAEVTNDHRMFLPFVGLVLSAAGVARSAWEWTMARRPGAAIALALVALMAAGVGTWQRNAVWSSGERAWRDAVEKNPNQARARMNLGVALMARGALTEALAEFEQAAVFSPNYSVLEVNLGVVKGALGRTAEAEAHFRKAVALTPNSGVPYLHYGIWLRGQQRYTEAAWFLEKAVAIGQDDIAARHELMRVLSMHHAYGRLKRVADETLARVPQDPDALAAVREAEAGLSEITRLHAELEAAPNANGWLDLSLRYYNEGNYQASLDAARQVLRLDPMSAEGFNNVAAALSAMGQWADAVAAAEQALAIKPDFALARNNLAWAKAQMK